MTYGDCACDILGDICDIPLSQRRGGGGLLLPRNVTKNVTSDISRCYSMGYDGYPL